MLRPKEIMITEKYEFFSPYISTPKMRESIVKKAQMQIQQRRKSILTSLSLQDCFRSSTWEDASDRHSVVDAVPPNWSSNHRRVK